MKLKSITLKNFRVFDEVTIPIEDISLFVGPNNSGKSSIAKAILLTQELFAGLNMIKGEDKLQIRYDSVNVDLGLFENFSRESDKPLEIRIGVEVDSALSDSTFNFVIELKLVEDQKTNNLNIAGVIMHSHLLDLSGDSVRTQAYQLNLNENGVPKRIGKLNDGPLIETSKIEKGGFHYLAWEVSKIIQKAENIKEQEQLMKEYPKLLPFYNYVNQEHKGFFFWKEFEHIYDLAELDGAQIHNLPRFEKRELIDRRTCLLDTGKRISDQEPWPILFNKDRDSVPLEIYLYSKPIPFLHYLLYSRFEWFNIVEGISEGEEYFVKHGFDSKSLVSDAIRLANLFSKDYPLRIFELLEIFKQRPEELFEDTLHKYAVFGENWPKHYKEGEIQTIKDTITLRTTLSDLPLISKSLRDFIDQHDFLTSADYTSLVRVFFYGKNIVIDALTGDKPLGVTVIESSFFSEYEELLRVLEDFESNILSGFKELEKISSFKVIGIERALSKRFVNNHDSGYSKEYYNLTQLVINNEDNKDLNHWVKVLEIADTIEIEKDKFGLNSIWLVKDGFKSNLVDNGHGANQLIPVLINCLYGAEKILVIEEPESNLHPNLQSRLAKFFMTISKNKKLIIETHSEYLVRAMHYELRKLQASNKENDKKNIDVPNVNMVYFNPKGNTTKTTVSDLNNSQDTFKNIPSGFLDEGGHQVLELLNLGKENFN